MKLCAVVIKIKDSGNVFAEEVSIKENLGTISPLSIVEIHQGLIMLYFETSGQYEEMKVRMCIACHLLR